MKKSQALNDAEWLGCFIIIALKPCSNAVPESSPNDNVACLSYNAMLVAIVKCSLHESEALRSGAAFSLDRCRVDSAKRLEDLSEIPLLQSIRANVLVAGQ